MSVAHATADGAGRRHLLTLFSGKAEVVSQPVGDVCDATLSGLSGEAQHGEHEGLVVGDGHACAAFFLWPRFGAGAAARWLRMRSSRTLAGSSFGSCGTSSPRNALASTA